MKSKTKHFTLAGILVAAIAVGVAAYPPAVGILGESPNCLSCHINNGSWVDGPDLIIDIVNKDTKTSLKQKDGSFLLSAKRGQALTVLTVIGYKTSDEGQIPYRNAWLYTDPGLIESSSLSKFPPGWESNLPMACRLVGDKSESYPDAHVTVLPMTIRPSDSAADGFVTLQVMLTKGESVKGKPKEGMQGNYFERILHLRVVE
ncbi:MAG: hypothetical protein A2W25_13550 [candidate division Zixibacteria bacterium RBG_16_53_22]|nr:MAG: hypothetical protein A2W25_13550 [candidate division Zixibacteria bacterium RBG_16_53_22]